jgi:lysozyme family protein
MAGNDVDNIIARLIAREGGFVDNPADPGGCTKYGITLAGWHDVFEHQITCDQLRQITRVNAHHFYMKWGARANIWELLDISPALAEVVFDTSVLFGPGRAIKWLQLEAGIVDDGIIGKDTLKAAAKNPERLVRRLVARRIRYHTRRCKIDPRQNIFLAGWVNRAAELLEFV